MVHVHFDAKYRVERVSQLIGNDMDDGAFEQETPDKDEARTAAQYSDLLKMHAYRDAIRRTAGAYVLYPGNPQDFKIFEGFHEVLPGLGAFAIRPDKDGKPEGIGELAAFLDRVIEHLANRTTARERVTYHIGESYTLREEPVQYGILQLAESDIYGAKYRALPPSEDMVLAAWYENDAQVQLAQHEIGFAYVRLGRRSGSLHVHPNLAKTRHVILRTHNSVVSSGLLILREPGFRVYTRNQLRAELHAHAKGKGVAAWESGAGKDDDEYIYALFKTTIDPAFDSQVWNGDELMAQIEQFEADRRNKPVENLGRRSSDPRILPLQQVLKTRISN